MSVLTISINDPSPALPSKSAEVAYMRRVLETMIMEFGRGNGTLSSGSIIGTSAAGTPNTSLGSWTYAPAATKP